MQTHPRGLEGVTPFSHLCVLPLGLFLSFTCYFLLFIIFCLFGLYLLFIVFCFFLCFCFVVVLGFVLHCFVFCVVFIVFIVLLSCAWVLGPVVGLLGGGLGCMFVVELICLVLCFYLCDFFLLFFGVRGLCVVFFWFGLYGGGVLLWVGVWARVCVGAIFFCVRLVCQLTKGRLSAFPFVLPSANRILRYANIQKIPMILFLRDFVLFRHLVGIFEKRSCKCSNFIRTVFAGIFSLHFLI